MVLLHDHLDSRPDLGQNSVDIASEFSFRDAERAHNFNHSGYSAPSGFHIEPGQPTSRTIALHSSLAPFTQRHLRCERNKTSIGPRSYLL